MTLWGGRFEEGPSDVLWRYTVDHSDRRLLVEDLEGSIAHAGMLHRAGLLSDADHEAIHRGLLELLSDARDGSFEFSESDEDVHSAVERALVERIGEAGRRLHTGRSRNDQVALDLRLYLRRAAGERAGQISAFGRRLVELGSATSGIVVPSYTHLQQAQAVPLGHHLLAHAWMALRARERFLQVRDRLGVSPLGAGASAGSSLPLDPIDSARRLGFDVVFANSMDAVGARDAVAEYAWCCAQAMVDLSRLAEELILWATSEFGWVTFGDDVTTGSSALPHKKNPDIAELARGRAAGTIGNLTALLALQKGLPLTYNRDLQEDKAQVFAADDALAGTLEALTAMLGSAEFHPPPPASWTAALDLAEALVARGVPFRDAHEATGRLVAALVRDGRDLSQATSSDLTSADPRFDPADLDLLDPRGSVARRSTSGGGSAASVEEQVRVLSTWFAEPPR